MEEETGSYERSKSLPWRIRHVNGLLAGCIICILLGILFLFILVGTRLYLDITKPSIFFGVIVISCAILFTWVLLCDSYEITKRYVEVIDALNLSPREVEIIKRNIIKFKTSSHGVFWLNYVSGGENSNSYYRLWVSTMKGIPIQYGSKYTVWERTTSLFDIIFDRPKPYWPGLLPSFQNGEIKSLSGIKLERGWNENRIVAILSDQWLRSEATDIIRSLEILREIERRM